MSNNVSRVRTLLIGASVIVVALASAACSSSGKSGSSTGSSGGAGASGGSGSSAAGLAYATKQIASILTKPSPIPINEPLKVKPTGKRFIFVQCAAPECAFLAGIVKQVAPLLGAQATVISAGSSVPQIQQAFASALQKKPDAVLEAALDTTQFPQQLAALKQANIPVIAWTVPQRAGNGLAATFLNGSTFGLLGRQMADYVISKSQGKAKILFYWVPEYTVFKIEAQDFRDEIQKHCPGCTVKLVATPVTTIGSSLPGKVVSDLQKSSGTDWVAAAFGSLFQGVPNALNAAHLKVNTIDQSGGQLNYQYMKQGLQTVDLGLDQRVQAWEGVDLASRIVTGQAIPTSVLTKPTPEQFLTKSQITFNPSDGWTAFPDFEAYFKKLWNAS